MDKYRRKFINIGEINIEIIYSKFRSFQQKLKLINVGDGLLSYEYKFFYILNVIFDTNGSILIL